MKTKTSEAKRHTVILPKIYGYTQKNLSGSSPIFSPNRWLISLFIIASILLALSSCEAPVENRSSRDFTIRYGERYASPRRFEQFEAKRLAFTAKFDESAVYSVDYVGSEKDKNILMGFTDCNSLHNENSARFSWQWLNARLNLYAHCYVNGTRIEEYLGAVDLNLENRYEIAVTEGQYVFYVNGEQKTAFERQSVCDGADNYLLFPYFAESVPAPHHIKIQIELSDYEHL